MIAVTPTLSPEIELGQRRHVERTPIDFACLDRATLGEEGVRLLAGLLTHLLLRIALRASGGRRMRRTGSCWM